MYVTRPLSLYLRDPSALSLPPPEGPNSGILVIQDEEAQPTCCFGLLNSYRLRDLPFPQNKNQRVCFQTGLDDATNPVLFIPVLNQPLSSNQYYVIQRKFKDKGNMDLRVAYMSTKEEDIKACRFCNCISYPPPQPLDPSNIYQKFEIRNRSIFSAKSVASDGSPPEFLSGGWTLRTSTPKEFKLNEAPGLNTSLRAHLPEFNFPFAQKCSTPIVVGKWYCPFMFIKDGSVLLKDQMKCSTYYEMTLEQHWEQVFCCENMLKEGNVVPVDVAVESEEVMISGTKAVSDQKDAADGVMWFRSFNKVGGGERNVGLRIEIVERMKWEQERVGWVGGSEKQVRVKRTEEFDGKENWMKFGCYALVERFSLKRMDGSLVVTFDFRHTHQIRSKWE